MMSSVLTLPQPGELFHDSRLNYLHSLSRFDRSNEFAIRALTFRDVLVGGKDTLLAVDCDVSAEIRQSISPPPLSATQPQTCARSRLCKFCLKPTTLSCLWPELQVICRLTVISSNPYCVSSAKASLTSMKRWSRKLEIVVATGESRNDLAKRSSLCCSQLCLVAIFQIGKREEHARLARAQVAGLQLSRIAPRPRQAEAGFHLRDRLSGFEALDSEVALLGPLQNIHLINRATEDIVGL